MDKLKLKRAVSIGMIIFVALALCTTYIFILFQTDRLSAGLATVMSVLRPLTIGAIFAYIMKSTANFYERLLKRAFLKTKKLGRKKIRSISNALSVLLTYITWFLAIAALLLLAIPQIVESVKNFIQDIVPKIPTYYDSITGSVIEFMNGNEFLAEYTDDLIIWLENWLNNELVPNISHLGEGLFTGIIDLVMIIKDVLIGLVMSVFILLGRKQLAHKCTIMLHCLFKDRTVEVVVDEFKYADKMFSGFLEGKVIDSAIIGVFYYIFLAIMDVPYPALVAVVCGVTNIIPIFGPFIGAIPSGFIILTANPMKVIPFVIFVFAIQFVDGYIIDPHIVGGNIKISSFSVIFAVTVFGSLWGFFGLLVGVPTFAVIYDISRRLAHHFLRKRGKEYMMYEYKAEYGKNVPSKNKSNKQTNAVNMPNESSGADGNKSDEAENKLDDSMTDLETATKK